jgi:hypothetical protein
MQNRFYSNREIGCLPNPTGGFIAWFRAVNGATRFVTLGDGTPEVFNSEIEATAVAGLVLSRRRRVVAGR